jgi:hypothetical protein
VISLNTSSGSLTSVGSTTAPQVQSGSTAAPQMCSGSGGPDVTIVPNQTQVVGSVDTDVMFIPGTNKIMLTNQRALLRTVIQEAFENVRASLLFDHGFPNANVIPSLIRESLIAAAETHSPKALQIHTCLLTDDEYLEKMIRLVSSLILR